ncbi:hypothetical protein LJC34_01915 [Oscillospiraceae bacterium OttesenSCG-928-G22]|nr:hypothetical protein [Oscillospiraceae bacterium OttesenSCG-928-G22]
MKLEHRKALCSKGFALQIMNSYSTGVTPISFLAISDIGVTIPIPIGPKTVRFNPAFGFFRMILKDRFWYF